MIWTPSIGLAAVFISSAQSWITLLVLGALTIGSAGVYLAACGVRDRRTK